MADDPRDPRILSPRDTTDLPADLPADVPADDVPTRDAPEADAAEDGDLDSDAPQDDDPPVPAPRPRFLGEIVQRRAWPLIAIVFVFGLFLAAVPFLFQVERSPFTAALTLYDRLCAPGASPSPADLSVAARALPPDRLSAALSAMPCVPRAQYRPRMDPVEGRQFGAERAFVVTLERRADSGATGPESLRFLVEEEGTDVRWSPWPAGTPAQ
jgi:hypothetical protein